MTRISLGGEFELKVILADDNLEMVEAWQNRFKKRHQVEIEECHVFESDCDALVCPGNSFGFMDSGVAIQIAEYFGYTIQDRLRESLLESYYGELPVGQAHILPTEKDPPWLVYAPTTRTTRSAKRTVNAYLAMRAALLAVWHHNVANPRSTIDTLAVPGLCTHSERMHPLVSARQMRYAHELVFGMRGLGDKNITRLTLRERKLMSLPQSAEPTGTDNAP